jgi:hypothetical protein
MPTISSWSYSTCWRNCAFCHERDVLRRSKSLRSLSMICATSGSLRRLISGSGKTIASAASRSLGVAPCAPRVVETFGDDRQVRACHGLVEAHDDIAALDAIAVANTQLADHAAGGVLHLLDIRINNDLPGCD